MEVDMKVQCPGCFHEWEERVKVGYLRKDDDGHNYVVPESEIEAFDELSRKIENTNWGSKEWNDLIAEFNEKYWDYNLGGSTRYLKVVLDE